MAVQTQCFTSLVSRHGCWAALEESDFIAPQMFKHCIFSVILQHSCLCVYQSPCGKIQKSADRYLDRGDGFVPDSCTAAAKQSWVSVGDLTCTTIQLKQSLKRELLQTSGIPRWRLEDNKTQQLTTYHFCLLFFMYFGKKRVVSLTAIYVIILIALTASYLAITAFLILMRL